MHGPAALHCCETPGMRKKLMPPISAPSPSGASPSNPPPRCQVAPTEASSLLLPQWHRGVHATAMLAEEHFADAEKGAADIGCWHTKGVLFSPKNPAEVHPKWDRRHCGSGRSLARRQFALWLGWPPHAAQPRRFEGDLGFTQGCAWLQGIRHQTPQVLPAPGSLQRCCDTSREVLGWLGTVCHRMGWPGHTLCLPGMTGEVLMVPRASLGSVGVWPARSCLPEQSRAGASPAGRRQSARVIATGGDKPWPEPAVSG